MVRSLRIPWLWCAWLVAGGVTPALCFSTLHQGDGLRTNTPIYRPGPGLVAGRQSKGKPLFVLKDIEQDTKATAEDELPLASTERSKPTELVLHENEGDGFSGLVWRGVVVVLCALWASNFAAVKLVLAEPGTL